MAKRSTHSEKSDNVLPGSKNTACRQDVTFDPGVAYLAMSNPDNCCLNYGGKQSTPLKPPVCWLLRGINERLQDYKGKGDKVYISVYKIARFCEFKASSKKSLESRIRRVVRELNQRLAEVGLPLIGRYESLKRGYPCPLALKNIEIEYPLSDKQIEIESAQDFDEDDE